MNENGKGELPILIADILVDDILESSEEEIVDEAQEQYSDVNAEVENTRAIINSAIMSNRKSKLTIAKTQLKDKKTFTKKTNVLSLSIHDKKRIILQAKESVISLTLAARNEEEMSEADTDGIIQDLIELGVIDENGSIK